MTEMSRRIIGTGTALIDLSTMVTTVFINCEVMDFQQNAKGLQDLVESNPKALSSDNIIRNLKTKSWSLKAQGLLSHYEIKKVDTEDDLSGTKMAMKNMLEYQKSD